MPMPSSSPLRRNTTRRVSHHHAFVICSVSGFFHPSTWCPLQQPQQHRFARLVVVAVATLTAVTMRGVSGATDSDWCPGLESGLGRWEKSTAATAAVRPRYDVNACDVRPNQRCDGGNFRWVPRCEPSSRGGGDGGGHGGGGATTTVERERELTFDAARFVSTLGKRRVIFVGDSYTNQQYVSLRCLLMEEWRRLEAEGGGGGVVGDNSNSSRGAHQQNSAENFLRFASTGGEIRRGAWAPFIVPHRKTTPTTPPTLMASSAPGGLSSPSSPHQRVRFEIYLDATPSFVAGLREDDILVVGAGAWFMRWSNSKTRRKHVYRGLEKKQKTKSITRKKTTTTTMTTTTTTIAHRDDRDDGGDGEDDDDEEEEDAMAAVAAVRGLRDALDRVDFKGTVVWRTLTVTHFFNGTWDNGGRCDVTMRQAQAAERKSAEEEKEEKEEGEKTGSGGGVGRTTTVVNERLWTDHWSVSRADMLLELSRRMAEGWEGYGEGGSGSGSGSGRRRRRSGGARQGGRGRPFVLLDVFGATMVRDRGLGGGKGYRFTLFVIF